ncbi:HAMP domain-containing histidine kinase [Leekyejoonella antrihumi]|uniref:histidine kinase n=2 Tax=Leekyejoonella antrihumi TaxID=1660198 RepID=A0A563DXX4_9MICO|nr:HAMP domain-containing histidine kinase [Leekyejoonella antrihumi]
MVVPLLIVVPGWQRKVLVVVLALIGGGVAWWVMGRGVDEVARPVSDLTQRAEQAGDGPVLFQPMRTGIDEIDRISQVFERRAGELTRTLAAEREFSSDASHQLRTPLTALLMRLDEISTTDDLALAREEARVGIAQVERLTTVVDELLQRSRHTPSGPVPTISLDSVIAALQREWQPAFEDARRSVRVGGERGLMVVASRSGLSQILSTLLENALAHGTGTVQVMARRSGPSVVVEVSDRGEGVDPAIAPRIFERRVTTGGTGLGLALARDLAQANGGRLELRSSQPAVFALFLSEGESN